MIFLVFSFAVLVFFVYFCRKISNDYEAINFCFMPIMAFCGI